MKTALMILLLASSALAQSAPAPTGTATVPGCGPADFSFSVKSDGSSHPVSQPEPGKALAYFLQDDRTFESHPRPTVKWGMDGTWVGATQADTYFYLSVDPGEHHLCAEWQSAVLINGGRPSAADHFTAEAGKVYYFRARDLYWGDVAAANVKLGRVNSDEAQLLMTQFGFSSSHPKK
jgi:Protein of unknown function (DUF2846)